MTQKIKETIEAAGYVIFDCNCKVIAVGKTVKEALQSIEGRNIMVNVNLDLDTISKYYFTGHTFTSYSVAVDFNDDKWTCSDVSTKPATSRLIEAFIDGLHVDGGMWKVNKSGSTEKFNCADLNANGLRELAKYQVNYKK